MAGLFGTDGVRARINTGAMTAENIIRLALATGKYFLDQDQTADGQRRPLVVIGKDTRLSGYMIEAALQAGFASIGMDTRLLGPLPTPGVAYLTRTLRADLGVMISASHNPHFDNGIKLFGPDGYKLPDTAEDAISEIVSGHIPLAEPADLGRAKRMLDGLGRYVEAVKTAIPRTMRFEGLKVVVDCANGAAYRAAPEVLFELGADVIPINVAPDGTNINQGCGAVHPETLAKAVVAHGGDVGIALDGDADRLILVDEKGGILNGDQCLAVIADGMAEQGQLKGRSVVGTLMTNHGLAQWFESQDIALERTNVGDRYVLERMRAEGFNLGGEPSGHILMTDHSTSGDAIMAALKMLAALKMADAPASKALRRFTAIPQRILNIKGNDRQSMLAAINSASVQHAINDAEAELSGTGRIVIRPSGTEPLLRVMVEAEDTNQMTTISAHIASLIEAELTP
ncbi:MAG: phosphoglucosamine mutase [Candidatus Puniceispirillales bacterium WSBS_2018_MAG_OTU23]